MLHNDPTRRALRLLSLLQSRRRWGGPELAACLGVTERTVRRDIERLRDIGYPVQATPGADGGYRLSAGTSLPPLVFDDDEAVAVAVGLRAASGVAISGVEQVAVQALAKIEQVLPKRLRGRISALDDSLVSLRRSRGDHEIVDPAVLVALAAACRDHEEVHFSYPRSEGDDLRRWVEPHQLLSAGSRWYLVAWDLGRDDWRTFRLDRLREVELAGARFDPREIPGGDAAESSGPDQSSQSFCFKRSGTYTSVTYEMSLVMSDSTSILKPFLSILSISRCHGLLLANHG